MGAIYGILGEASRAELEAMGSRLRHRGALAREWSPAPGVHLGQRSAVSAVETADPPPLAFDGFLDNAEELAKDRGRAVPPTDLPSLLWALLREDGPEAATVLRGQFALAYWDPARSQLVLIRDLLGVRPLYSTRARGRFLFASEYKALLAIADVEARPDREALQHIQCTRYPKLDATLLAGVRPVARGAWTAVDRRGGERSRPYGRPHVAVAERTDAGHIDALRASFLEGVQRQIAPFDPVGVQLSGGLDSSIVLGAIRKVAPARKLHTFTAGYGPDDPQVVRARALARELGTVHHELVLEPQAVPTLLPPTLWHMEEPFGREDTVYLYFLAREASRHVELLMAGYNADMTVGGMPRHRLVRLAHQLPWLRRPLAEFYDYTQTGRPADSLLGRGLVAGYFRGRRFPVPRVRGTEYLPEREPLHRKGSEPFNEHLLHSLIVEGGWEIIEGLHSAFGLRFNAPFMDRPFIECAFAIPDRLKFHGGTQKWVLRRAADGLVPAEVLTRKKTLQRMRHDASFSDMLDRLADEWLAPADVVQRDLFDPGEVAALRRRPGAGAPYSTDQAYRLWTLLISELWCRLFLDGRGRPPEGLDAVAARPGPAGTAH